MHIDPTFLLRARIDTRYAHGEFDIFLTEYSWDGLELRRPAILITDDDKQPIMKATVLIVDPNSDKGVGEADTITIKNYSENEGILDELVRLNLIEEPFEQVPAGWAEADHCKMKGALLLAWQARTKEERDHD